MPHTWVKKKYTMDKSVGKYKSKHNDGKRRSDAPRRKMNDKQKIEIAASQPLVTLVILSNGKRRFTRVAKNQGATL